MPDRKVKVQSSKFKGILGGYSLIELLIVISIFGITVSLVTASYLTFERNQRFKNAALQLKSDIRYAQNKSSAGDKSLAGCIDSSRTLLGWYVNVVRDASSYGIYSDCRDATGTEFTDQLNGKSLPLPTGVTICSVTAAGAEKTALNLFFQPLSATSLFFLVSLPTPGFYSGTLLKVPQENGPVQIYLMNSTTLCKSVGTYKVVIQSNGKVNEVKLTANE